MNQPASARVSGNGAHPQQLHAVVLSGSGADGAYQVGVMKALAGGTAPTTGKRPIDPRVFAGTSTGAFNASLLVSKWNDGGRRAVDDLERIWRDRLSWHRYLNGSFRMRLNPLELLDPRAYAPGPSFAPSRLWGDFRDLSKAGWARASQLLAPETKALDWLADNFDVSMLVATDPWKETIADAIDFEKIRTSRRRLTIATTNWHTGEVCHFENGHGSNVCPAIVRAASAVPGIHGPEAVNGQMHVDAAQQMISPLKPALDQLRGLAESEPGEHEFHLHVVYMSAKHDDLPASALESMLQTLYGSQVINWDSKIDQDLIRAGRINQGIEIIEDLAALDKHEERGSQETATETLERIKARVASMPKREKQGLLTAARHIIQRRVAGTEWKQLTIHRYFPARGLDSTLGFIDFRRSRLESLIEQGFVDTVGHDCEANRCIRIRPAQPGGGRSGRGDNAARRGRRRPRSAAKQAPANALPHPTRHALIFSGGGAYGAYQAGVARALFNGHSPATAQQPLCPEVFAGTSIGAFNASFLVAKWHEGGSQAIESLERAWLKQLAWKGGTNGAFRVRMNPNDWLTLGPSDSSGVEPELLRYLSSDFNYLREQIAARGRNLLRSEDPFLERLASCFDPSTFVGAEPWEETIRNVIDFEKIRTSSRSLTIAATNWARGRVLHFGNRGDAENVSPEAVRASSAIPGFYPPVNLNGETCVDGAVLMNTPLKPAIGQLRHIASQGEVSEFVLHVVYISGEIEKASSAARGTLQTLFRSQAIHWGSTVEQDIEHARTLNQGLALVDMVIALGEQPGTSLSDAETEAIRRAVDARSAAEGMALLETSEQIMQRREEQRPYKQLTIHRYFPRKGLGGVLGFVDVRRSTLERLIQEGFNDAVSHNCADNGCVIAGNHPPA